MHHPLACPNCKAAHADAIPDALVVSGSVILVCGIDYAKFEEFTRSAFSEMASNFEKHFGACFARYQSGGSHKHDFTLVVIGEGNDKIVPLLQALLPRLKHIVVFGPKTAEESNLLLDGTKMPPSSVFITAPGIEGSKEYFAVAMRQAVKEASLDTLAF